MEKGEEGRRRAILYGRLFLIPPRRAVITPTAVGKWNNKPPQLPVLFAKGGFGWGWEVDRGEGKGDRRGGGRSMRGWGIVRVDGMCYRV